MSRKTRLQDVVALEDDPLWYKDAIIYELHVRAFMDSNGDGIGDFPGLIEKLDYLQDLGVTALWVLPFYPSPLRDDGYDIADYDAVNPIYGNLADFQRFLDEAHRRGLRVITELVVNHTSDQHPWFQRARRSPPGSPERDFYVWSDTPERFKDARIIFKDFESSNWTWDAVAHAYYWHRFYSHQPDLNYDNPQVHEAVFRALDYWMDMGVDGVRLDAIPYLYEREGTNCENLPETHVFLKSLRRHVDEKYRNRLLLAEANQWPEDTVAYLGDGDECHMCFHFPVMPRLFMAIQMEDRHPILDILRQTPAIPETCQWAMFLRNHDELTLEMVTEDERDYMYRVYAQDPQARINLGVRRRLAPLMQNNRAKIELMNGLLLSLPGTPVLYYGDEIGMGDNIYLKDRDGVRTPMQWGPGRNAGFSTANPQRLYLPAIFDPEYHFEAVNVEAQQNNVHSLLWWTKRLLALRKRHQAFGRGALQILSSDNPKTLAFVRLLGDERILVVANLSRFAQCTWIDLADYKGMAPVEMLGRGKFALIGEGTYCLTLGPYAYYWFTLTPQGEPLQADAAEPPQLTASGAAGWEGVFRGKARVALEEALPAHFQARRWFQGRFRTLTAVTVRDTIPIPAGSDTVRIALVQVDYADGDPDLYVVPLAFAANASSEAAAPPGAPIVARLRARPRGEDEAEQGVLYDPSGERSFVSALLEAVHGAGRFAGDAGDLRGDPTPASAELPTEAEGATDGAPVLHEGSSTTAVLDGWALLKIYRRVEDGPHPEVEVLRRLAAHTSFTQTPPLLGVLEYQPETGPSMTLGIVQQYIAGEIDAWRLTLDALHRFFDRILTGSIPFPDLESGPRSIVDLSEQDIPPQAQEALGSYLETARLMAQRTAELHVALSSGTDDPAFAPEPFTPMYQRSLYQSMRGQIQQALERLRQRLGVLPEDLREPAQRVLRGEEELLRQARRVLDKVTAVRIRCHGAYHLKHLVSIGKDFLVVDFEGEAERPLSHRRRKRSPIRDLTSLHRSLQDAAHTALTSGGVRAEDVPTLQPWALFWQRWASVVFLKEYRAATGTVALLPQAPAELRLLFDFYGLGWAVFQLIRELDLPSENLGPAIQNVLQLLAPMR